MNVYSQLIKARIEQTASDLASTISGLFWHNTTSKKLKFYDGTGVKELVDTDSTQVLTGKELDMAHLTEQTSVTTPSAGKAKLYAKATGRIYVKGSDGVEKLVGSGGGGSSLIWTNGDITAEDESQDGITLRSFNYLEAQDMYLTVNVPQDYIAGTPIKLQGGAFFINATSGNILFRAVTALIKPASTVLGTYTNTHTSTNTELTAAGVANRLTNIGDIDLTNSSGTINGVAVAAGDKLRVKLSRLVGSETSPAAEKAKLLINNLEIKFTA